MGTVKAGQQILHYRITGEIGSGGMGQVYKAEDLKLRRTVAIKILGDSQTQDDVRRRLLREARAASALSHPNIVTVHAIEEADGLPLMVMEYVAGEDLSAHLQLGPMRFPDVLDLGIQLAGALSAAHATGVVHRDIKPGNIVLSRDGVPKLLDFGLSQPITPSFLATYDTTLTQSVPAGRIVGTIPFMSPEQVRGEPVDGRSDLFSLAAVLYQAATGQLPFRGNSLVSLLHEIAFSDPPRPSSVNAAVPSEFDALLLKALAKDPERRYASMSEFHEALRLFHIPQAAPVQSFASTISVFVGRERELERLQQSFREAMGGRGRVDFDHGRGRHREIGVGKRVLASRQPRIPAYFGWARSLRRAVWSGRTLPSISAFALRMAIQC
jgi:serine/threonine protein kinase